MIGYTNQSFRGIQNVNGINEKFTGLNRFNAFQVGVAIPLLPGSFKSKIAAAKINEQVAQENLAFRANQSKWTTQHTVTTVLQISIGY